jgi:hypothetical protein
MAIYPMHQTGRKRDISSNGANFIRVFFYSRKKSMRKAARKTKQIQKLLHLLESKAKSLADIIKSFAHLVGEPVCRGRKGKKNKNNVSKSDLSGSSSDEH